MSKEITRRQFCALGVAGAVMAVAGGLGAATAYAEEGGEKARAIGDGAVSFSREVDVLIVGAGISGMFAAIEPAKAGLKVLLVEQNSMYGGDAIYSAACQMCTTAKLTQEERPDKFMTPEQIRERFAPYYVDNEEALDRTVLLQEWAGKFIDKMHYEWGYEFQPLRESPYHQAFFPKDGLCTMKSEFDLINEKVTEAGAEYLFRTTFKTLIVDENGTVCGARVIDKDGNFLDIAAKAVALATGGYVSNQEWMVKYAPEWAYVANIISGRKGDGIAAGLAAGGTLFNMGPVSNLNPRFEAGHMLATFYPLIGLLPNGKRFYCETAVHNAATGALNAGYYEWYSVWTASRRTASTRRSSSTPATRSRPPRASRTWPSRPVCLWTSCRRPSPSGRRSARSRRIPSSARPCSCRSCSPPTTSSATTRCATRAWAA